MGHVVLCPIADPSMRAPSSLLASRLRPSLEKGINPPLLVHSKLNIRIKGGTYKMFRSLLTSQSKSWLNGTKAPNFHRVPPQPYPTASVPSPPRSSLSQPHLPTRRRSAPALSTMDRASPPPAPRLRSHRAPPTPRLRCHEALAPDSPMH